MFFELFYRYWKERIVKELWVSVIEELGKVVMIRIFCFYILVSLFF